MSCLTLLEEIHKMNKKSPRTHTILCCSSTNIYLSNVFHKRRCVYQLPVLLPELRGGQLPGDHHQQHLPQLRLGLLGEGGLLPCHREDWQTLQGEECDVIPSFINLDMSSTSESWPERHIPSVLQQLAELLRVPPEPGHHLQQEAGGDHGPGLQHRGGPRASRGGENCTQICQVTRYLDI